MTKKREKRWLVNHPNYLGTTGGGKLHVMAPAEATGCTKYTIPFYMHMTEVPFGTAWRFNSHYTWCWKNGKLSYSQTSHYINHDIAGWSGWQWEGFDYHVEGKGTNSAGHQYQYWRDKATFKFCFAYYLPFCVYRHPWVAMTVRGDGSYYFSDYTGYTNGRKSP